MNNRILNIIEQHESSRVEFKSNFNSDVVETICAFSNANGGNIFIGINNNQKIIGVQNLHHELVKDWINTIKTNTLPQLYPDIVIHAVQGKQIAEIIVQEYPVKPVACRGKFFKRLGSSNHLLQADEIAQLQLLSINSSFDSFVVDKSIDELDSDLIIGISG